MDSKDDGQNGQQDQNGIFETDQEEEIWALIAALPQRFLVGPGSRDSEYLLECGHFVPAAAVAKVNGSVGCIRCYNAAIERAGRMIASSGR